jgi:hypothetical protein
VLPAQHFLRLTGVDLSGELLERAAEIVRNGLSRFGPFDQYVEIIEAAAERGAQLTIVLEAAAALQQFLRPGLVLPEVGSGNAFFYIGKLGFRAGGVKDGSAGRGRGAPDPRTCEADLPIARPNVNSSAWCPALVLTEGLRPSDSPTRALARRFADALPRPLKLRWTSPKRLRREGGPVAWLARHARSHRGTSVRFMRQLLL